LGVSANYLAYGRLERVNGHTAMTDGGGIGVWRGWREEDKGMAAATMSGGPSGGISANVNARDRGDSE